MSATRPASFIGPGHSEIIGGREFSFGWARYATSNGDRERGWNKIDGKRVPKDVFIAECKAARAAAQSAEEARLAKSFT